jgi:hypothetical protein
MNGLLSLSFPEVFRKKKIVSGNSAMQHFDFGLGLNNLLQITC